MAVLCCVSCQKKKKQAQIEKPSTSLADLPDCVLHSILAMSSSKVDSRREGFDDLEVVHSGAKHLFLPAPGSSGIREALFDAVFGLN
mmetsp:Transcript_5498/g.6843  ORF Transcript_5498/g.6843 Transcript_5498/m.6843 type:complete len:87 (-) Transcript_5498:161-421(-)